MQRPQGDKVDGDGERDVVGGIDSDSELPGIKYAFPRPTRSSWRPPIQLRKGDDHTAITTRVSTSRFGRYVSRDLL
jgi:hypothetical protein